MEQLLLLEGKELQPPSGCYSEMPQQAPNPSLWCQKCWWEPFFWALKQQMAGVPSRGDWAMGLKVLQYKACSRRARASSVTLPLVAKMLDLNQRDKMLMGTSSKKHTHTLLFHIPVSWLTQFTWQALAHKPLQPQIPITIITPELPSTSYLLQSHWSTSALYISPTPFLFPSPSLCHFHVHVTSLLPSH